MAKRTNYLLGTNKPTLLPNGLYHLVVLTTTTSTSTVTYEGWFKDEQCTILHNPDGPAEIDFRYQNTRTTWYIDGKRHREDGPAMTQGTSEWWFYKGKQHREDGPAYTTTWKTGQIIRTDHAWYLNDKRARLGDYPTWIKTSVDATTGDVVEKEENWHVDGKLHRIGAPAVVSSNGDCNYYVNGKMHRHDGPASIHASGSKYYLYGKVVPKREFEKQKEYLKKMQYLTRAQLEEILGTPFYLVD